MANANTPFGLKPVADMHGNPYNGSINQFAVPATDNTAIFIGDPVKLVDTGSVINGQILKNVAQAATGDTMVGAVVAVLQVTQDSPIYRAASTERIVLVADDPDALFEIQQVSTGTPLTVNDIGLNADFVVGSGSTVTGMSGVTLNNATEATTNTLDLKILGMPSRPDNDYGTSVSAGAASSKFYVRINRHVYVNQTAGV